MSTPKVSVLVPIYKTNETHLRQAIESILNQTFTNFELILLDDCPDDSREHIVSEYSDTRIKYYKNPKNLGISASRNKLLELSSGKYIAIFDHDDISLKERLEKQVDYLDSHPDIGAVSSNVKTICSGNTITRPTNNLDIKAQLRHGCIFTHTAAMLRKSILIENNIRWEEKYSPAEDYMLWIRLIDKTMFFNFKEPLVLYRDHENNTSTLQIDKMKDRDWLIKQYIAEHFPLSICNEYWHYLFGFIPLLKIKTTATRKKVYLFGIFQFLVIKD